MIQNARSIRRICTENTPSHLSPPTTQLPPHRQPMLVVSGVNLQGYFYVYKYIHIFSSFLTQSIAYDNLEH